METNLQSLEALRAQAQAHLEEIEQEKTTEHLTRLSKQAEVEKYTKQRKTSPTRLVAKLQRNERKAKDSHAASSRSPSPANTAGAPIPNVKGPKLRTAQDVLDRIRHDHSLKTTEYTVGYLERFDGLVETPAANWVRESTDEEFVPQHRIKYVRRRWRDGLSNDRDEVVWSRDERVDRVFGSGE